MILYIVKFVKNDKFLYLKELKNDKFNFCDKISKSKTFNHKREIQHFIKENHKVFINSKKLFEKLLIVKIEV